MLRTSPRPVSFTLDRDGGARILAQAEVWQATPSGWVLIGLAKFADAGSRHEERGLTDQNDQPIQDPAPGHYTTRFRCIVSEKIAIGGNFKFSFAVAGVLTFKDEGNVNTTPSSDDSRHYDDLFELVVT